MRKLLAAALLSLSLAASPPQLTSEQRLAQAQAFAHKTGDKVWRGYGAAPFDALLIEPDHEILLCRRGLPDGFEASGRDPATGCARATRPRSDLSVDELAAMPVFGLPATLVMGTPAATGRTVPDWIRTILHEHFHQWQMALPSYYERARALGLAGPDGSAMWMLNFAFPYADPAVSARYAEACGALADAVTARGTPGFGKALDAYLLARDRFAAAAGERNWRYYEFELWQEGVARWTEIVLGRKYPDPTVRADAAAAEGRVLARLRAPDLATQQRDTVYYLGAGEAMILEACDPFWRTRYPKMLALGPLFDSARRGCVGSGGRP